MLLALTLHSRGTGYASPSIQRYKALEVYIVINKVCSSI